MCSYVSTRAESVGQCQVILCMNVTLVPPSGVKSNPEGHFHVLPKTISISVLIFSDFVRLSIVFLFQIMFSDPMHHLHTHTKYIRKSNVDLKSMYSAAGLFMSVIYATHNVTFLL